MKLAAESPQGRGNDKKSVVLIGNRHFVIEKRHFGICRDRYVELGQFSSAPSPIQEILQ
jgi:hypothetical protein